MTRLAAALSLGLAAAASAAPPARYLGEWANIDAATGGVTRLVLAGAGKVRKLQAFGKCSPEDCDWGVVDLVAHAGKPGGNPEADAEAMTAAYDQGFKTVWVVVRPRGEDALRAEFYTRYSDARPATATSATFRRAGRAARPSPRRPGATKVPAKDCLAFDPRQVQAVRAGGRWKVAQGKRWLMDFGSDASQARKAVQVIRQYGLQQQCFVGRPDPSLQYFLVNGQVPRGEVPGEDCVSFSPARVQLEQVSGRWKIVDGSHWLFDFGGDAREAREAFAVVKASGASRSCFVGRPNPAMSYLRR